MDPITRASKVFLKEAAAHWKARRGPVLFLVTEASSRGDVVKTLRLAEQSPACRRPLFLFEAPFEEPEIYWEALAESLSADYKSIQKGAAEEGVSLSDLVANPKLHDKRASGYALCALRSGEIVRALDGKLEGIDVALVPRQVTSPTGFRDAVTALAAEMHKRDSGARLLVLALAGGPLSEMAEGRSAHFHVDPDELMDYLKNLGDSPSEGPPVPAPSPPRAADSTATAPHENGGADVLPVAASKELRALLLSAAQATHKERHEEATRLFHLARETCAAHHWALGEAVTCVALAGAYLAAGALDNAAESYQSAFALATRTEAHSLAAQAALGKGAVRMQQKRYLPAMNAYGAAATSADLGRAPMLQSEARRMEKTAALLAGKPPPLAQPAPLPTTESPSPAQPVAAESTVTGRRDEAWITGPVDLSRVSLPVLPFEPEKKS